MRDNKPNVGLAWSLFLPVFIGGAIGWVAPYLLLNAPLTGDRFLDGVLGLVICAVFGGVVGALLRRR
jgi:hypothetical protein